MIESFIEPAILVLVYMTFGYILSLILKDNSIADVMWGLGFILIAYFTLIRTDLYTTGQILVTGLVTIWGVRLSLHIWARKRGEDPRYKKWRKEWKFFKIRSFLQVWMLQGLFMLLIATSIIFVNTSTIEITEIFMYSGALVWLIGFLFEAIGDAQLKEFLARKRRKKLMTEGLWKYTRHPNYFGEAVQWWGIFIIAASTTLWAIISPLVITFLLRFVSGVPLTEKRFEKREGWDEYKKKTNAFIPWFPR